MWFHRKTKKQTLVFNESGGIEEEKFFGAVYGEFGCARRIPPGRAGTNINNEGSSIKKKEDTHKMAEANKAFAHFR